MPDGGNDVDPLLKETESGFNSVLGYRLIGWRADFARLDLTLGPQHLNRSGQVHGGVLAAMLDFTLAYSGVFNADPSRIRRSVTLSISTNFLGSTRSGRIVCSARRRGGGNTIFMSSGEIVDDSGNLIAIGEGVFRYIPDLPKTTVPLSL